MTLLIISQIIFYLTVSVALLITGVLIFLFFYNLAKIAKNLRKVSDNLEEVSDDLKDGLDSFLEGVSSIPFISSLFKKRSSRKKGRSKKRL